MHRRSFLSGLGMLVAAPAIIRVAPLMPVKSVPVMPPPLTLADVITTDVFAAYDRDKLYSDLFRKLLTNPHVTAREALTAMEALR